MLFYCKRNSQFLPINFINFGSHSRWRFVAWGTDVLLMLSETITRPITSQQRMKA